MQKHSSCLIQSKETQSSQHQTGMGVQFLQTTMPDASIIRDKLGIKHNKYVHHLFSSKTTDQLLKCTFNLLPNKVFTY